MRTIEFSGTAPRAGRAPSLRLHESMLLPMAIKALMTEIRIMMSAVCTTTP